MQRDEETCPVSHSYKVLEMQFPPRQPVPVELSLLQSAEKWPPKDIKSQSQELVNACYLEEKIFADVIKLRIVR